MPRCLRAIIYDGRGLLAGGDSASSRRLVLAASRCKLSLRPGGWLYQAMLLLLTRACSRSARSGGEGRVSACVSDDRACAARQPDNQTVLSARAYVRCRRLSQIFASLLFAHDTLFSVAPYLAAQLSAATASTALTDGGRAACSRAVVQQQHERVLALTTNYCQRARRGERGDLLGTSAAELYCWAGHSG